MSASPGKLSWDDLRIIKAIGESRGLAAAAAHLGLCLRRLHHGSERAVARMIQAGARPLTAPHLPT